MDLRKSPIARRLGAHRVLTDAYETDLRPVLAARASADPPLDPVEASARKVTRSSSRATER